MVSRPCRGPDAPTYSKVLQVDNMRLKRPIVIREFFARLNISFRHGNHLVFPVHFPAFRIGGVRMIKKAGIVRAQNIVVA
jgi:hypothetical protein